MALAAAPKMDAPFAVQHWRRPPSGTLCIARRTVPPRRQMAVPKTELDKKMNEYEKRKKAKKAKAKGKSSGKRHRPLN